MHAVPERLVVPGRTVFHAVTPQRLVDASVQLGALAVAVRAVRAYPSRPEQKTSGDDVSVNRLHCSQLTSSCFTRMIIDYNPYNHDYNYYFFMLMSFLCIVMVEKINIGRRSALNHDASFSVVGGKHHSPVTSPCPTCLLPPIPQWGRYFYPGSSQARLKYLVMYSIIFILLYKILHQVSCMSVRVGQEKKYLHGRKASPMSIYCTHNGNTNCFYYTHNTNKLDRYYTRIILLFTW